MFKVLNKLYTKDISLFNDFRPEDLFMLIRWLKHDIDNVHILKRLDKFQFTINPGHFLTLLFFGFDSRSFHHYTRSSLCLTHFRIMDLLPIFYTIVISLFNGNHEFRF